MARLDSLFGRIICTGCTGTRIRFIARRHAAKIRGGISPEDRARFEDINRLYGTSDPKEREKLLGLQKELDEKVRQSLKK